jgi:long-chain acyl-CoA synthetase
MQAIIYPNIQGGIAVIIPAPGCDISLMEIGRKDVPAGAISFADLLARGAAFDERQPPEVHPDDVLLMQFTSGTTSYPKGVMLSHSNLITNVIAAGEVCPVNSTHKVLSFLPLSHIFERMLTYLYIYVGAGIYYAESLETIGDNLKEVQPFAF